MATVAAPQSSALQRERAFFFYMALAVLVTVLAGFGFFFAIGASTIYSPWWVHLHALSMGTWVLLFVAQTWLVYRDNVTAHRTLGPIAAGWAVWIFFLGFAITAMDVHTHRAPPFFQRNYFLMMDWLNMVVFGALVFAAVRLRNRSDWHKRLMLGAMLNLLSVALGRLVLPPIWDERGIWLVMIILLVGYFGTAMLFDKRTRGSVHPAYFWGAGGLVTWVSLSFALAWTPPVLALTHALGG